MNINVYSIKDNKVGTYGMPFFSPNEVQATRNFARSCHDTNVQISIFPSDFDLFYLGSFDDTTGKFFQDERHPQFIIGGMSAKKLLNSQEFL